MPDCDYCGESFGDEDASLEHLRAEHYDELGSIDKRRVDAQTGAGDDGGVPVGPLAVGGIVLAAAAIVGYVVFVAGGSGGDGATVNGIEVAQTPTGPAYESDVHDHGTINMTVAGERVDFSQRQYQLQSDPFHFENGDGERWHVHAPGVTLEYGMATLGIDVSESTVTFDGTTYSDGDSGTDVVVEVNGDSVTPSDYVLQDGDHVRIVVRTA
jgi:sulfur carrier protein ThiS